MNFRLITSHITLKQPYGCQLQVCLKMSLKCILIYIGSIQYFHLESHLISCISPLVTH
jgi:hypothetical protein